MKIVELVISIKKTNLILFNRNTQLYNFHKNATKTEGKPTFRNRRVDRRVEKVLRCLTNAPDLAKSIRIVSILELCAFKSRSGV